VAIEVDKNRRVNGTYFKKIENYSSKELSKIFDGHISSEAKVTTDKCKVCLPLKKQYHITQIKSNVHDFLR
jgi:hypothetical protein